MSILSNFKFVQGHFRSFCEKNSLNFLTMVIDGYNIINNIENIRFSLLESLLQYKNYELRAIGTICFCHFYGVTQHNCQFPIVMTIFVTIMRPKLHKDSNNLITSYLKRT